MNPPSRSSGAARDVDLDRLLRSASKARDDAPAEMPFGFDTRVVALSRKNGNGSALTGLLRYVTLAAAAVILFASAGAYLEFNRNADRIIGSGNEYAIADSVIQDEVAP
jgi:hypothetical protein